MTTSLLSAEAELSKQMGDYWSSTTTGAGLSTTLVDTALKAKANDWIDGDEEMYAFLVEEPVGSATIYDERKISSLDNSDGTLTTLAFDAAPGTGIDYEVHRLFTPSEKRRALVNAAKKIFPHLFKEIRNESMVSGNWLKDGSFEIWSSSSALTYWTTTTSTITKTTSSPYYKHGLTSCKISTAAGTVKQSITNWDDLKRLQNQTVTFSIQARCDTASCLRISINDGVNQTYSSYHAGDSAWTQDEPRNDNMYVQQFIDYNPTEITFTIHHEVAAATSYVDDGRGIGSILDSPRIYIGDLGLVKNKPSQVLIESRDYSTIEPWALIQNILYDQTNGYMQLPSGVSPDYRLRILGNGYLDFYDSSDVVGTDWDDTIAIDHPQTEVLVAQAAIYLCEQKVLPTETSGDSGRWERALAYWKDELRERKGKFSMQMPEVTVTWGIE